MRIWVVALLGLAIQAQAADKLPSAAESFLELCAVQPPEFNQIDNLAASRQLPALKEQGQFKPRGPFVHSKQWEVQYEGGTALLLAVDSNGAGGRDEICGLKADDADGASFRTEIITKLRLGPPSSDTPAGNGTREALWKGIFGPDSSLLLVYSPSHPGVEANRMTERPATP